MDEISESKVAFSLELYSRDHIKRVALPDGSGDRLVVEGNLGCLSDLVMVEDILLEINGVSGKIRIDITREDLEAALSKKKRAVFIGK